MIDPQQDAQRSDAADPTTPSERLAELAQDHILAPLVAGNPNAPFDLLCELANQFPREVLANPVLPLLYLEDPRQFGAWPATVALNLLRDEEDLPAWFVDALAGHKEPGVSDAARHHVSRAGESHDEAGAIEAIKHAPLNTYGNISRLDIQPSGEQAEWLIMLLADHHAPAIRRMIAAGRNRPEWMLAQLAGDPDESVRIQIAGHPRTPSATLVNMAHDGSERVLQVLARRKDLPAEMAMLLAENETYQVRFNLADNASTPAQALAAIAADDNMRIRECVARHPSTTRDILERLAADAHARVREAVARNHNTPGNLLDQLADDENDYVSRAVAQNPMTPESTLERLAERRRDIYLMEALAARPALPEAIQRHLAGFWNDKVRAVLAANETLPEVMLAVLATDFSPEVREAAAANPAASPELLARLAYDESDSVCRAACMNAHMPVMALVELAQGELRHRLRVAQQAHTPAATIMRLARDADRDVRKAIAQRRDLPIEVSLVLAADAEVAEYLIHTPEQQLPHAAKITLASDPKLCIAAHSAEDPHTERETLAALARHDNEHIRCLVAHNSATPFQVIIGLCDDGDPTVSKAARGKIGVYAQGDHSHHPQPVGGDLPIALHQRLVQLLLETYADQKSCDAHCLLLLSDPILIDDMLAPYVTSRWWLERYIIARHPNTGAETLRRLAHDGNRFVRAAARGRLQAFTKEEQAKNYD